MNIVEDKYGQNEEYNAFLKRLGTDLDYATWRQQLDYDSPVRRSIVELGAGFGSLVIPLWADGYSVEAVDLNPEGLAHIGVSTHAEVPTHRIDFTKDQIPGEKGAYLLRSCLLNMLSEDDVRAALSRIGEAASNGSIALFEVYDPAFLVDAPVFENEHQTVTVSPRGNVTFEVSVYHKHDQITNIETMSLRRPEWVSRAMASHGFEWLAKFRATPLTLSLMYRALAPTG